MNISPFTRNFIFLAIILSLLSNLLYDSWFYDGDILFGFPFVFVSAGGSCYVGPAPPPAPDGTIAEGPVGMCRSFEELSFIADAVFWIAIYVALLLLGKRKESKPSTTTTKES